MEKRLFLAIGLSLMVVWLWSASAPKPGPATGSFEVSQPVETKDDSEISEENEESLSTIQEKRTDYKKDISANEKIEVIDSEKINFKISNIGAALKDIKIKDYNTSLPLSGITRISQYEDVLFTLEDSGEGKVSYVYEDDDFKITKMYEIEEEESYIIKAETEIYNKTDMSKLIELDITNYVIEMSSLDKKNGRTQTEIRNKSLNEYAINLGEKIHRKGGAFKFSPKEEKEGFERVVWSGFRNRYFCFLVSPQYDTEGYKINPISNKRMEIQTKAGEVMIPAKEEVYFNSVIYAGPEKIDTLKKYGLQFEKIKKYYRFALFNGIAMIIDSFMRLLYKAIPNWGICIIITSIVVYFSMYPLTMKGMLSMKRMQSLQPMIVKLKEKHKDNPQKMNKEMMELYKEHKVNPLGGCLPMLLQMPVFIGLYQVLWRSVSFNGAHFLWIKDLSQPDRLFIFPFTLPVLGNELNLLPLIMVVVMFFQQKLSAKNMVIADQSQAAQQKMMATIMPVFLGFIFYKFASGLTLYFTMFYFFSTLTQWKMSKSVKTN